MPESKVRVVGSSFTTFNYNGVPLAFLEMIQDSGQRPVGTGFEAIHPLNQRHPIEIVTARAISAGTLNLRIRELWNAEVWQALPGLESAVDIVDVYQALAAAPGEVSCQMIVKPPGSSTWRGRIYHGCVVTSIDDSETVTIETLSVAKGITVAYTHKKPLVVTTT